MFLSYLANQNLDGESEYKIVAFAVFQSRRP